ncbi:SYC2L protein, partial [Calyptomena viridis]|nr:SYC2L protein [Calyptomena viridis]
SSYRKHLFSESNNENTSPSQSEKSWILDFQNEPLPKSVDYGRKRPRVRSKLKVLPVSSASSGSDNESKKGEPRQRTQKEMLRKKTTSSSKGGDIPIVNLADDSLSEEPEGGPLSPGVSARGYSSDVEKSTQRFHDAPGKLTREEGSIKQKNSEILSSTLIKKPKLSSWDANHLSSDTKLKKISDSVEDEVEMQKGKEMDESLDEVFFSNIYEDFSHLGTITAFETFVDQLKKLFWSRYKRMKISTQNSLRSSEK